MERDEEERVPPPARRVPGRYVVYVMLGFGAVFLAFMMLLALRLDPAADRFRNGTVATRAK